MPLDSARAQKNRQMFAYAEEKVPPQAHFGLAGGKKKTHAAWWAQAGYKINTAVPEITLRLCAERLNCALLGFSRGVCE